MTVQIKSEVKNIPPATHVYLAARSDGGFVEFVALPLSSPFRSLDPCDQNGKRVSPSATPMPPEQFWG